jgi:tetrapyrrole methylase family protein/MazG family protein
MKAFDTLVEITDTLLGPNGCPWDRAQTLKSIRYSLLEEACEVMDAIAEDDDAHLVDELGDLFFNALFLSRLAENEGRGSLQGVLEAIIDKLIRRHPHVFGEGKVADADSAKKQWEELKKLEPSHCSRKSAIDGIPKGLPALARAQKIVKKIERSAIPFDYPKEDSLGSKILELVLQANQMGVDSEQELRAYLLQVEKRFKEKEALLQ